MRERKSIQVPESAFDCCNCSLSKMKLFSSSVPHSIKPNCQRKKFQHIFNTCAAKAQILIKLAAFHRAPEVLPSAIGLTVGTAYFITFQEL